MAFESYPGEPDIRRLIAAFKGEEVDRVPNFEVLIEDQHVEKMLGRYAGNTLAYGGDPAKGIEEAKGARPMYPKDYVEVCQIIGQDAIIIESIWTPFKKYDKDGNLVQIADRSVKTRADWREVILPTREDIEAKLTYVREYKEVVKGTKIGVTVLFGAFFQTLYEFVVGMTDFMTLVYEDREFAEEMLEASTDYWVEFVKALVNEGVDFLYPADDVAFKTGLFIPPQLLKEIWVARMERILKPAVEKRIPILFHSDGKIDDIVVWLKEIGIDCISPMDPYGIDYRDYKKRFGNIAALHGNIDIEFPLSKGTPADVEKDVREHMEVLKPGYGYVCGSSHSIVNYIPHENFQAMINAIHRYGVY
jgi:uroporphyrinogen decarboxylase